MEYHYILLIYILTMVYKYAACILFLWGLEQQMPIRMRFTSDKRESPRSPAKKMSNCYPFLHSLIWASRQAEEACLKPGMGLGAESDHTIYD